MANLSQPKTNSLFPHLYINLRLFHNKQTLVFLFCLIILAVTSFSSAGAEEHLNAEAQAAAALNIYISAEQLIYEDSALPFDIDGSFATLRKSSTEQYFWHSWGDRNYKFHGPLYDPLQTKDWEKSDTELFDYNGKGDPYTDRILIYNIYKRDNGDLLGFCHIEKYDFGIPGYVEFAIGLIYSTDNGDHWIYCGEIIRPQEDTENIGGVPYLVIGEYFYVYYNELPLGSDTRRISVARAEIVDVLNAAAVGNVIPWQKYNNGWGNESGLTGVGSSIIPGMDNSYDVHSDSAYNRTLGKYMLTVQTHNHGQLLMYTSTDGINWGDKMIVDETDDNNFIQAYSFFLGTDNATDDSREVGSEFYIYFPRKDWPGNYAYDEFYRRLVTIGYQKDPPPLPVIYKYIFSNDFSAIQGENSWYYQYKTGDGYYDMSWIAANNWWNGNETYLLIGAGWLHPGDNSDAALKWIAPQKGLVTISGIVGHDQDGCPEADGVDVQILHGNNEVWSHTLETFSSATHEVSFDVVAGEPVYFIVNKRSNFSCDTTNWNPTISLRIIQPGDVNGDNEITLADSLLALKAACNQDMSAENITHSADVNSDNKIGLAEVIFVIQTISGLR
jgi:hypothetical protein